MPTKPVPTPLSQSFWDALRERGQLKVPTCGHCGQHFFAPEPLCPHCGQPGWQWKESSGVGQVYSFTVVHQAMNPEQATPFVLAIVELDEQWSLLTCIVGAGPASVEIGSRVRFAPTVVDAELTLPTFALA